METLITEELLNSSAWILTSLIQIIFYLFIISKTGKLYWSTRLTSIGYLLCFCSSHFIVKIIDLMRGFLGEPWDVTDPIGLIRYILTVNVVLFQFLFFFEFSKISKKVRNICLLPFAYLFIVAPVKEPYGMIPLAFYGIFVTIIWLYIIFTVIPSQITLKIQTGKRLWQINAVFYFLVMIFAILNRVADYAPIYIKSLMVFGAEVGAVILMFIIIIWYIEAMFFTERQLIQTIEVYNRINPMDKDESEKFVGDQVFSDYIRSLSEELMNKLKSKN